MGEMNRPTVSVVIPTYNRAGKVVRAIRSVLDQTYTDLEVIVVDDGSTDDTEAAVRGIADPRVRYVRQENQGACAARNHGTALCTGAYMAFHDSDDVWRPEKLEKEMRVLLSGEADIVFCRLVRHYPDGTSLQKPDYGREGPVDPVRNLFGIGTQTLAGRREVFTEFPFDPAFPRFQEFEMLYRAVQKYRLYCVDEGLVDYYVGEDSISSNPAKLYRACALLTEKHPELPEKYPEMGKRMAENLLEAAVLMKKAGGEGAADCVRLARACTKSPKLFLKGILGRAGVYTLLRR